MSCVLETQREHCDERSPLGGWSGQIFSGVVLAGDLVWGIFTEEGPEPSVYYLFWLQPTVRIQNQNAVKCFDTKEMILQSLWALEGKVLHIKRWRAVLPWLLGWRRVKQMTCDWRQLVPACPHGCLQQQHVMGLFGSVTELGWTCILVRASLQISTFS